MGPDEYFRCAESIRLDLLNLYGRGYVIEHCIAAYSQKTHRDAFESYVTDALKNINESLAKRAGGSYMSKRFYELVAPKKRKKAQSEKTGEEIAVEVITKLGLKFKEMGGKDNG